MKITSRGFAGAGFLAAILSFTFTASAQQSPSSPASRPALPPAPRYPQQADTGAMKVTVDATFWRMHLSFLDRIKQGPIDLLFLGDSITDFWRRPANLPLFTQIYGKYDPANFGISGDQTQHVLWRIENGELDGINPKVLVLLIGTNNVIDFSADDILKADTKIISEIHQKLPNTKVLVLGIFPRADFRIAADPKGAAEKIKSVNAGLAKLDDGAKTRFLDFGDKFLDADGKISMDLLGDALHPTTKGYQVWADAMQPLLDEMMK
jgi:lysophospholipase L1-like esterase